MKSPFPGMDPWLENPSVFPDLHDSLSYLIKEDLNANLPRGYVAGINRLVWVDEDRWRKPDVSTFGPGDRPERRDDEGGLGWQPDAGGTMLAVEDDEADVAPEPWTQQYLEILETTGRRLVTAIEVVSPSNKAPSDPGHQAYLTKRRQFLGSGVNLVELDFLRGGTHVTAIPRHVLRAKCGAYDYHACVSVPADRRKYLAAFRMTDPLPTIDVPLDPGVKPVPVALQPLFVRAYRTGRYDQLIDYRKPCDPPLTAEQAEWAAKILGP